MRARAVRTIGGWALSQALTPTLFQSGKREQTLPIKRLDP